MAIYLPLGERMLEHVLACTGAIWYGNEFKKVFVRKKVHKFCN